MFYRIHDNNATGAPYRSGNRLLGAIKFWKNIESADTRILKKLQFLLDSQKADIFSEVYINDSVIERVNYFNLRKGKIQAFQLKSKTTLFVLYQLKIFVATFFKNLRRRV